MELHPLDWGLIALYLVFTTLIALKYRKRSGKNIGEFFLGGRSLPWFVAGISMVATTFAADTPLAVTELVVGNGISGNWLWWNALIGGMLTTFFFARLWRRANILTEVEFINIRYGGKPAYYLRGFKSVYLGLFMNVLVLGWVNLALQSLLQVFFGLDAVTALMWVGACMILVALYSSLSGFMGVAVTDMVQFFIAMGGSIVLAVLVLNSEDIGGVSGLKAQLGENSSMLEFFPKVGEQSAGEGLKTLTITIGAFLSFVGFQWWASWYPGAEPGGGGYVAQRMMSAKNEKHSLLATLFFQVAHYALRPWPWILVGLCTVVIYSLNAIPDLDPNLASQIEAMKAAGVALEELPSRIPGLTEAIAANPKLEVAIQYTFDSRTGYVFAMRDYLPTGLKGLLLVAFLAAYMSTISTQLNWGASYLLNDLYKSHLKKPEEEQFSNEQQKEEEDKHYVLMSRVFTLVLCVISLVATMFMDSISGVWDFIYQCGAGLGLVLILRWFWWRINAWSEIAATITPFVVFGFLKFAFPEMIMNSMGEAEGGNFMTWWDDQRMSFFVIVGITTFVWLLVTFLTSPEKDEKLNDFYRRVRPGGFWKKYGDAFGKPKPGFGVLFVCWISAVIFTYSCLFAFGKLIFGFWSEATIWIVAAVISGAILYWLIVAKDLFKGDEDQNDEA